MRMTKATLLLTVSVALAAAIGLQARSDRAVRVGEAKQREISRIKKAPANVAHRSPISGSQRGYRMETDMLDGFGGASESENYRMPVNSGGHPQAMGISEGDDYEVEAGYVPASQVSWGDASADGIINLGDVVYIINYLFKADAPPCPMEAGDANCDGMVELGDAIYLINYLFRGGPSPAC